ncbi:MAG: hypothetical protein COA78_31940, partial [Blastopirellula sp.]
MFQRVILWSGLVLLGSMFLSVLFSHSSESLVISAEQEVAVLPKNKVVAANQEKQVVALKAADLRYPETLNLDVPRLADDAS